MKYGLYLDFLRKENIFQVFGGTDVYGEWCDSLLSWWLWRRSMSLYWANMCTHTPSKRLSYRGDYQLWRSYRVLRGHKSLPGTPVVVVSTVTVPMLDWSRGWFVLERRKHFLPLNGSRLNRTTNKSLYVSHFPFFVWKKDEKNTESNDWLSNQVTTWRT